MTKMQPCAAVQGCFFRPKNRCAAQSGKEPQLEKAGVGAARFYNRCDPVSHT